MNTPIDVFKRVTMALGDDSVANERALKAALICVQNPREQAPIPSLQFEEIHGGPATSPQMVSLLKLLDRMAKLTDAERRAENPALKSAPNLPLVKTHVGAALAGPTKPPRVRVWKPCANELAILDFVRAHPKDWFGPVEIHAKANFPTPVKVSTVYTYCCQISRHFKSTEGEFTRGPGMDGMAHFCWAPF